MKSDALLLLLLVQYLVGFAQSSVQKFYGGAGNERAHAIITTYDGGYAIAGHTDSYGAGGDDFFVLKLENTGVIQWQKTYGGTSDDNGLNIALMQTPDTGFVITGATTSFGSTARDLYVLKIDSNGNLVWDFKYDSGPTITSTDNGRGLLNTSDGDLLLFGTDDSYYFGASDGLILRIDDSGMLVWKHVYGGISNDHLHEAVELPGGSFIVCGLSQSFGPGNTAAYLLKIKGNGDILWGKTYGGSEVEGFSSCDLTTDFSIIATGLSTSYGAGQTDVLLCKIDTSGTLQWTKTFGGFGNERGASVRSLPDGSGYLLSAYSESYGNGSRDILVIRTNTTGEIIWSKTFGTQGYEGVDLWANGSLALTNDNGFVVTGWSDSLSAGGDDVVFIKSDLTGSSLCEDVNLISTAPNMTTRNTSMSVGSVGTYLPVNSLSSVASMVARHVCYCIPESICNGCQLVTDLSVTSPYCSGENNGTIVFQFPTGGTPPYTYSMDGVLFQTSPLFSGLLAGSYSVIVRDSINCEWDSTITMMEDFFTLDIGPDLILHIGDSIHLNGTIIFSGLIDSLIWGPKDLLSCTHCLEPMVTSTLSDSFMITATAYAGNCVATDALQITAFDRFTFFVPNIFSPNQDNVNDFVTVFTNDNGARVLEFEIFDRWGNVVFRGLDFPVNIPELGWDGRFKGQFMNPAVFVYVAKVQSRNGLIRTISGDIAIIQ